VKIFSILFFFCILLLSACTNSPSEQSIQTAIALTNVANSTEMPSFTPSPTQTSSSTSTFTSTVTLTVTLTPTLTNTPIPPDKATATAFEYTKQAKYIAETATKDAYNYQLTATQEAYVKQLTATKEASFATQTQAVNDEEALYAIKILDYLEDYIINLENVSSYASLAGSNILYFFDDDWINSMKTALDALTNDSYDMANIYPVPERFVEIDRLLGTLYNESYNLELEMVRGIDNLDADAIERATDHMINIGEIADQLEKELDKVGY